MLVMSSAYGFALPLAAPSSRRTGYPASGRQWEVLMYLGREQKGMAERPRCGSSYECLEVGMRLSLARRLGLIECGWGSRLHG